MSEQAAGTLNSQGSGKPPVDEATTAKEGAIDEEAGKVEKEEKTGKKKKPGFFARWKESTSKAYDAHRAAGGNL